MKTLSIAIAFDLFLAIAVTVSFMLQWPAWVSFYSFGRTVESSSRAFIQMGLGIMIAVLIQLSAISLMSLLGKTAADKIKIRSLLILIIYIESTKFIF